MSEPHSPQPFDEHAALEELERLAEKIQISRRQRAQAVDEFDAFVRGFKEDRWAGPERRAAEPPLRSQPTAERRAVTPAPDLAPRPIIDPTPDVVLPIAPTWKDMIRQPIARWTLAAVGVLVIIMLVWRPWATVPNQASATSTPAAAPSPVESPSPVPAAAPPVAKPPARAVNVELVTLRPVWTRVTIDDRKELEREIPGGQHLTFGADRAITIRAGDAGGMRLIVDGKDIGVLGKDGQIASKTFTKTDSK